MSDSTTPSDSREPSPAAPAAGRVPGEPLGERAAGTLRLLVEGAPGVLVRVRAAPAGLDVPVRGTMIHDPGDPLPPSPAAVLLLVGTDVTDPRACGVVRRAAERGFTAVVVKERGQDPARLAETAVACGVAVLTVGDAVPWRQVDAELSCALAAYGIGGAAGAAPAGGAELFALADTLAAVAGGSVAIEDLDQNVVAYSKVTGQRIDTLRERGILQRRVPDIPEQRRQYREVLAAPGVVRFPARGDELARAAVAVRAGALPLGTLWAIEPADGLSDEAAAALRDAARLAAPHLLRALHSPETERRLRRDAFRGVLHGAGPPADEAAERLGLRPGEEFCLTAFAPEPGAGPAGAALLGHLESVLVRHCAAHQEAATVVATVDAAYVLLPATGAAAARRFAEAALAVVSAAVGDGVRAAVTRPHTDLLRPAALRREADDVLRATARDGHARPAAASEDVRHRILLDRLGDELVRDPWLRLPGVTALLAHDREQGTAYAATVLAWLAEVGDVAAAAARLTVHPNTLRHRLRRVRELFPLDLDDPDVRLTAWLELRGAASVPGPRRP
ncbi:PucR family transcriptional regulator [Streptomyces sp. NPDC053560]|uniref:PucR family transcriptional regulator n=1 Tax=Streptomyces sp. NPDC053560 TaxID=3365711 RepID=UPI0037CD137D